MTLENLEGAHESIWPSVGRSVDRSFARPVARPVGRSLGRVAKAPKRGEKTIETKDNRFADE